MNSETYFCKRVSSQHLLVKALRDASVELTFLSPSLNSFHSFAINAVVSGSLIPLKSPLACRFTANCANALTGRLVCRSSSMALHFERLPDLIRSFFSFVRSLARAWLAVWISSAVWDSTQRL